MQQKPRGNLAGIMCSLDVLSFAFSISALWPDEKRRWPAWALMDGARFGLGTLIEPIVGLAQSASALFGYWEVCLLFV